MSCVGFAGRMDEPCHEHRQPTSPPWLLRAYSCCLGIASSCAAAEDTRQMDLIGAMPPTKR